MHSYTRYEQTPEGERKAVKDVLNWLGPQAFKTAVRELKRTGFALDAWRVVMEFGGVQGFPVTAFYNRYKRS